MLYISGIISLSVQLIVALIDFWGLTIVTEEQTIFKDLLKVFFKRILDYIKGENFGHDADESVS